MAQRTIPPDPSPAALPARPVGSFHYSIVRRSRPHTLATWRATSPHPPTIRRLATLLGGHPQPDPVTGQVEVITTTNTLDIILAGPEALTVRWQRADRHTCDGDTQRDAQGIRPCTCPADLNERKTIARRGDGCGPRTLLRFQLSQAPDLGMFGFANGTWSFANDVIRTNAGLQRIRKPATARLRLVRTAYTSGDQPAVMYTKPTLAIVRARTPTKQRRRQHRRVSPTPTGT